MSRKKKRHPRLTKKKPRRTQKWWWFSFSTDAGSFLGGVCGEGETFEEALARLSSIGLNPGGQPKGAEMVGCRGPSDIAPYEPYVLYGIEDMSKMGGPVDF